MHEHAVIPGGNGVYRTGCASGIPGGMNGGKNSVAAFSCCVALSGDALQVSDVTGMFYASNGLGHPLILSAGDTAELRSVHAL